MTSIGTYLNDHRLTNCATICQTKTLVSLDFLRGSNFYH